MDEERALPVPSLQVRDLVEMIVARDHRQLMLEREGRNPQVILGNRTTALPQLLAQRRVVRRGPNIDRQHDRFVNQQVEKPSETIAIAGSGQAVSVFSDHDHRQMMSIFIGQDRGSGSAARRASRAS